MLAFLREMTLFLEMTKQFNFGKKHLKHMVLMLNFLRILQIFQKISKKDKTGNIEFFLIQKRKTGGSVLQMQLVNLVGQLQKCFMTWARLKKNKINTILTMIQVDLLRLETMSLWSINTKKTIN